tara:strand:+ start:4528 stop:4992 length:465 start_codon:yes stop_codon:yes gene_type:complete
MQNFIKSQTRLAFIQYIFQLEFSDVKSAEGIEEFQKYFYKSNIAIIGENKEFKLQFNKNFLKKLSENYLNNFSKDIIIRTLNTYINLNRKFENWDRVLKSIIFAIISELQISDKEKFKVILNDYINISKSLLTLKETKLMNAIIQKYLDDKVIK